MYTEEKTESRRWRSLLFHSLLSAALMGALILLVYHFQIPNPNMILITALVFSAGAGGLIPGSIAAVMMIVYSMFFFSTDHSFFSYSDVNLEKMAIIVFGAVVNLLCVGLLKRNRDHAYISLRRTNQELTAANRQLESAAYLDALTGLRNRFALRQDFELYVGTCLYVLFMDLDNFKQLNDIYGHALGDSVLSKTGALLSDVFRTANCYRYGGDEFLVISEDEQEETFQTCCRELQEGMHALIRETGAQNVSFSGGYVQGTPESGAVLRTMILQADEKLYDAKRQGKTRIVGGAFDRNHIPESSTLNLHKSHVETKTRG